MGKANKLFEKSLILIIILMVISVVTFFFTTDLLDSFRIVFGSVFVLFLPGFILSYCFFPHTHEFGKGDKKGKSIDWLERIVLSFALSIAIVPLTVFYLNLIGLSINTLNVFFTVLGICVIGIIILAIKSNYQK